MNALQFKLLLLAFKTSFYIFHVHHVAMFANCQSVVCKRNCRSNVQMFYWDHDANKTTKVKAENMINHYNKRRKQTRGVYTAGDSRQLAIHARSAAVSEDAVGQ